MKADLQVIGTGFGRTGTDSMRIALDMLGFGPCHHMRALIEDPAHERHWRAFHGSGEGDWDVLLGGYRSCVDWPSAAHWRVLTQRFPDAKVLLTWRTAESWWASFDKTIRPRLEQMTLRDGDPPRSLYVKNVVFGGRPLTREHCIRVYEDNVAAVRAEIPEERLLIYKIGDGWQPLCAHLGVPVPDAPFPRTNDAKSFWEWVDEYERVRKS